MSSKYIDNNAYATSGYTLSGVFKEITVGPLGIIGGPGIVGSGSSTYTIINHGRISGSHDGISLHAGGNITNTGTAAEISGGNGVFITSGVSALYNDSIISETANGTAHNGTVSNSFAAYLGGGGTVYNGTRGTIIAQGTYGVGVELKAAGSVDNAGTIRTVGTHRYYLSSVGIILADGGNVTNAATGLIDSPRYGIFVRNAAGTLANAGTIESAPSIGIAVEFFNSVGVVSNLGSKALIEGSIAVEVSNANGTVDNTGTIISNSTYNGRAIVLDTNRQGIVTNGTRGLIEAFGRYSQAINISGEYSRVTNYGVIDDAVVLNQGGVVLNEKGGAIDGAISASPGTVINAGTINAMVVQNNGPGVTADILDNESGCMIDTSDGVSISDTLINLGTIAATGTSSVAVQLFAPELFSNSSDSLIEGASGIYLSGIGGSLTNHGTIEGGVTGGPANAGFGIHIGDDDVSITNTAGAVIEAHIGLTSYADFKLSNAGLVDGTGDTGIGIDMSGTVSNLAGGVIEGYRDGASFGAGTLSNNGVIKSIGTEGNAVEIQVGLLVNNAGGLIEGYNGVRLSSGATVDNAGSIVGIGHANTGVFGGASVVLSNQAGGFISGNIGVELNGAGTISNGGTIRGQGGPATGLYLFDGLLDNLSGGVIDGTLGLELAGPVTAVNTGLIEGTRAAVYVASEAAGARLTNAASADITGTIGLLADGAATILEYGTISSTSGSSGTAIQLARQDVLVDEAGSAIFGRVVGGGGTLELAGSTGTLTGAGSKFVGFGLFELLAGSAWNFAGDNIVASGTDFVSAGTLIDSGILTLGGTATVAGTISGGGTLALTGTETLSNGAVLGVGHLDQSGGSVTLAKNLTYNGSFLQTAGPIKVSGYTLVLNGAASLVNGAVSGSGFLATYGAVALTNYTINAGAVWQVCGTAMATSSITLGNGGGGSGRLAVETGGTYDIVGNGGVVVAPGGSGTVANFALFEKTGGTGISTVTAAFDNAGKLYVTTGALDLAGPVSGSGSATIGSAGALRFDSAVTASQTIAFAGTTGGRLALNDPSGSGLGFAGIVQGFGGKDQLDLTTFAFAGNPDIGWSQTSASSGTLTVTEGSKAAHITLFGQYSQAGFAKTKDGGSGTDITYTTPAQVTALAPPHR